MKQVVLHTGLQNILFFQNTLCSVKISMSVTELETSKWQQYKN